MPTKQKIIVFEHSGNGSSRGRLQKEVDQLLENLDGYKVVQISMAGGHYFQGLTVLMEKRT